MEKQTRHGLLCIIVPTFALDLRHYFPLITPKKKIPCSQESGHVASHDSLFHLLRVLVALTSYLDWVALSFLSTRTNQKHLLVVFAA